MKEFIISGHSTSTDELFTIPKNVSIIFYADKDEVCYIPENKIDLDTVLSSMYSTSYNIYNKGEQINNYSIYFTPENIELEGISEITMKNEKLSYNFYIPALNGEIKLSQICDFLKQQNPEPIKLYCIFCRGSEKESHVRGKNFGEDFSGFNERVKTS